MPERKSYNFIFDKLVESETDLIGLVAYGVYKKHKIQFLESFKSANGRVPEDEECKVFHITSSTPDQLSKYRREAESLVSDIVMNTTIEEIQSFESDMLQEYEDKIAKAVVKNTPSSSKNFWNGLFGSVVGAFIFSILAGLFYFIGITSDRATFKLIRDFANTVSENNKATIPSDSIQGTINYPQN